MIVPPTSIRASCVFPSEAHLTSQPHTLTDAFSVGVGVAGLGVPGTVAGDVGDNVDAAEVINVPMCGLGDSERTPAKSTASTASTRTAAAASARQYLS